MAVGAIVNHNRCSTIGPQQLQKVCRIMQKLLKDEVVSLLMLMQNTVSASDLYQINNRSWDRSLIVFEKKGGSGNYSLTRFILCEKIRNEDFRNNGQNLLKTSCLRYKT